MMMIRTGWGISWKFFAVLKISRKFRQPVKEFHTDGQRCAYDSRDELVKRGPRIPSRTTFRI